jgi:predicted DNA binding protein
VSQSKGSDVIPVMHITQSILVVRGQSVMLDADLAELYGVSTKRFNEQVRRNQERFPADFMFRLTDQELSALRSQTATSNEHPEGRGGRRYLPYAFTEHGAIMAATILNSARAAEVSVFVVRAFVKLREVLFSHKELAKKLEELERKLDTHDQVIVGILTAIREHMHSAEPQRRPIGFTADLERKT